MIMANTKTKTPKVAKTVAMPEAQPKGEIVLAFLVRVFIRSFASLEAPLLPSNWFQNPHPAHSTHFATLGSCTSRFSAIAFPHAVHQPHSPSSSRASAASIRARSATRRRAVACAIACCCSASIRLRRPTLSCCSSTTSRESALAASSASSAAAAGDHGLGPPSSQPHLRSIPRHCAGRCSGSRPEGLRSALPTRG